MSVVTRPGAALDGRWALRRTTRAARVPPRTVLAGVLAAIVVALGLYAIAPRILPPRIYEGPLVQLTGAEGVTLVWYLTRPTACTLQVNVDGEMRSVPSTALGVRHMARVEGLAPGRDYPYKILAGARSLTTDLSFRTSRNPDEPFAFIVFGDSGRGTRAQYLLAAVMRTTVPAADFLLQSGDVVYPNGARADYEERFFAPYRHLIAAINIWPSLGNHDLGDDGTAAAYREVFELPDNGPAGVPAEGNYWFDYASARLAVVDSNLDEVTLRDHVAPWLHAVLADPTPRWKFVVLHHPPYTGGKYKPDERIQRTLVPVLEATGVDLVFNGHDHNYQRTWPLRGGQVVEPGQGVVYVITGAGGATLYEARPPRPAYVAALDDQHWSFTHVSIDEGELRLRQIALDGSVLDEWRLSKAAMPQPPEATTAAPDDPEAVSPAP